MTRKVEHAKWPGIEIAIAGADMSPADLPARTLVDLVSATLSVFRSIADEQGVDLDDLRLVQVRKGSAACVMRTPDPRAEKPFVVMERQIRARGEGASEPVRKGIDQMYRVGSPYGPVRFTRLGHRRRENSVFVVPPDEPKKTATGALESATEVYAVVAGVVAQASERYKVSLRLDDGATQGFPTSERVASAAAKLFLKPVRASVVYSVDGERQAPLELESLEPCTPEEDEDLLGAFARIRAELASDGVLLKASDWLSGSSEDE